jgi:hypothetical protein
MACSILIRDFMRFFRYFPPLKFCSKSDFGEKFANTYF